MIATVAPAAAAAAAIDLRTRRVPNVLTALIAAIGVAFGTLGVGGATPGSAAAGIVFGFLLMLPAYLLGRTGAGDVKLFAALGALVGPAHIFSAFFYMAIAGGILAIAVAARRKRLRRTLGAAARIAGASVTQAFSARDASWISPESNDNRFAYAPAIAIGTVIAALGL